MVRLVVVGGLLLCLPQAADGQLPVNGWKTGEATLYSFGVSCSARVGMDTPAGMGSDATFTGRIEYTANCWDGFGENNGAYIWYTVEADTLWPGEPSWFSFPYRLGHDSDGVPNYGRRSWNFSLGWFYTNAPIYVHASVCDYNGQACGPIWTV